MITEANSLSDSSNQIIRFIKHLSQSHQQIQEKKDFSLLNPQTHSYLQKDRHGLQAELEQAKQTGDHKRERSLKRRLDNYSVIEKFFLYLARRGQTVQVAEVSTEMIIEFFQRDHPASLGAEQERPEKIRKRRHYLEREKGEIKAFFARAEQQEVILHNPMCPLIRAQKKLEPKNLSPQTQADCQAFRDYLQRRVAANLLSPLIADSIYRHLIILLHDAEQRRKQDPTWPVELDGLFADPKWIWEWLNNLENRSISTESTVLARGSIAHYLSAVRHTWLFLKAQGRASNDFYSALKEMFKEGDILLLPGRAGQTIEPLSEAEEEVVFQAIAQYSSNKILKLRDLALFTTGIETTIRMAGLNSMRIENFKELETGIWVCRVKIKRSSQKSSRSPDQLSADQSEWGEWYMSPGAISAINSYLIGTGRDWTSQGPVWLTRNGRPLSCIRQQQVIKNWLTLTGCKITRPHVLRHTGIERLVNKYNLPVSVVQLISQHSDSMTLLKFYSRRSKVDAFKEINQLFPAEESDPVDYSQLILSISTKLNEISAAIGRRAHEGGNLSQGHVKELLSLLNLQIRRLARVLGYETASAAVSLSVDESEKIEQVLQALGTSYQQILGYRPKPQQHTWLNPLGRKPKA